MNHYNSSPEEKEEKCRDATQTCIDALLDDDTHLSKSSTMSEIVTDHQSIAQHCLVD
jgi:Fanconi-associated nuclease 1